MESGVWFKMGVVGAVLLACFWVLTPTFMGKDAQKLIEAAAERAKLEDAPAPATPDPWWVQVLPNKKVNLGLDLQGGIDLTLEVEVDEAVRSSVQRDVAAVKMAAPGEKLVLDDVRRDRKAPAMLIAPGAGTNLDAVKEFMSSKFRTYQYKHSETIEGKDFFYFEMLDAAQAEIKTRSVEQALETIRNRVDETGVKEPSITKKGETAISIQLPGETDLDSAIAAIGTTAKLEFILVDEKADTGKLMDGLKAAETELSADDFKDDEFVSQWLIDKGYVPHGRQVLFNYEKGPNNTMVRKYPMMLLDEVVLTGDDVNTANTDFDSQSAQWTVSLAFKPHGGQVFADVTGAHVDERFAIVLDRQIRSAPKINERIAGNARITIGNGDLEEQRKEASNLALVLRSGALPAPVVVGEHRTVGASLGEKAIHEGTMASLIGCILVFLFAGVYYRVSGLLADISLFVNLVMVVALLAVAGATLTLPGICGIALTIGMAVDCNIIIYERIREELRAGKSIRVAIGEGFDRAFIAVFDSNITTLLAGVVLYTYGTGPLRGFSVTLMIGIFTTLFTGVFVSRALMEWANYGRNRPVSI